MEDKEPPPSGIPTETLQLNTKELEVILNPSQISEHEIAEYTNFIYGRMLSGKTINKVGLKRLFESLWQNKASVKIEDYADGINTLTIEPEALKNRILKRQPWHFAGSYLILIEADAMTQITPELFQQIPFWVQVHGIPPGHLANPYGERLGMEIANSMGEFMEYDPNYRRSFMRFRVRIATAKPLLRGKFLKLNINKENIWVSFRYERLSKFCYFCGQIDHIQKDCAVLIEELESGNKPTLQYNDSLKTVGLGHVISTEANMAQKEKNKNPLQMVVEPAQTLPKVANMDSNPNTKRFKIGNTNEDEGTTANTKKQKEAEEGVSNIPQTIPRPTTKGVKGSSPSQKPASRNQNETITK